MTSLLVVDNFDSFVHNLARYLRLAGAATTVIRNDALDLSPDALAGFDGVVLSPGPKTPRLAGRSLALLDALPRSTPVLGVCLGHQCIAEYFGGRTRRSADPMHGRASTISHSGSGVFRGAPSPLRVGRYHSLVSDLPAASPLRACAWSDNGEIMAIESVYSPHFGVQFHPESLLTEFGAALVKNFVEVCRSNER